MPADMKRQISAVKYYLTRWIYTRDLTHHNIIPVPDSQLRIWASAMQAMGA